ncbi:protein NASP homolog [Rhagoletis pomonella]|uniref:protein NASP homolog n=1 Tax=Rhagoletis pomonella TaxID=28610 RepID=UPI00177F1558|nr:protein NASP homolog [Rhagoletis pomonella]XP_036345690.1 protein NASP homolog [Rhagoletis pomonella]
MSAEEQIPVVATDGVKVTEASESSVVADAAITTDLIVEQERAEKILNAKELYSHGSRNFLVKSYVEAADELSQVCALYEELYGEQSDELGMPYLLYAKSLIALALDENKVIDVPDEEELEDDDEEDGVEGDDDEAAAEGSNGAVAASSNGATAKVKLDDNKENDDEADSTGGEIVKPAEAKKSPAVEKPVEDGQVSSTDDVNGGAADVEQKGKQKEEKTSNGAANGKSATRVVAAPVLDGEKPSTSNGDADAGEEDDEEENEAASNLQLAWEILELAAKIFIRQGTSGLPNLAEVQTELANIEFENNLPEAAREDYVKALKIYSELPTNYRRAMAEIHYKIGLTYLMQQLNKEGAESLKDACTLIDAEIKELEANEEELSEKQKNNIQDMEETKQEIWAKIAEIEDTQAQNIAEVRAALDSYIKPINSEQKDAAGPSSSSSTSAAGASSSSSAAKPTDISHLIKRKKPDEQSSEAEAAASPAKRPAV